MNILALEPYYGGSHKAFLDGWSQKSRHKWTILGLPPYKWKWRMRHSAVTFARQTAELVDSGKKWDLIFCSDMLNLAEFLGLAHPTVKTVPSIAYFHENQLSYPVRYKDERDYHFASINMTTALAAARVWFNSDFHRRSFLNDLDVFLKKMPDYRLPDVTNEILGKSEIHPPGINEFSSPVTRNPGPARILWAARWEFDKNPEMFFEAIEKLENSGMDFRISAIGESFKQSPAVFEEARAKFAHRIDRWGYQKNPEDYNSALSEADIVVSTADHEFFGIGMVEAIASGAYPVLPKRLAYPEIIDPDENNNKADFFYDGSRDELAAKLSRLIHKIETDGLWGNNTQKCKIAVDKFRWKNLVPAMDDALEEIV